MFPIYFSSFACRLPAAEYGQPLQWWGSHTTWGTGYKGDSRSEKKIMSEKNPNRGRLRITNRSVYRGVPRSPHLAQLARRPYMLLGSLPCVSLCARRDASLDSLRSVPVHVVRLSVLCLCISKGERLACLDSLASLGALICCSALCLVSMCMSRGAPVWSAHFRICFGKWHCLDSLIDSWMWASTARSLPCSSFSNCICSVHHIIILTYCTLALFSWPNLSIVFSIARWLASLQTVS